MKPLIYGYLQVAHDARDGDVRQIELALKFWAEQEGFCFATIFHEYDAAPTRPALSELVEEIVRAEARHVVMLSLAHLSTRPALQRQLLEGLKGTGVQVHVLQEELAP